MHIRAINAGTWEYPSVPPSALNSKNSSVRHVPFHFRSLPSKVNTDSVSEHCGLQGGDLIMAVNGENVAEKSHKAAQDAIVRAGNNVTLTVQR